MTFGPSLNAYTELEFQQKAAEGDKQKSDKKDKDKGKR
jgi:hypothetical protein